MKFFSILITSLVLTAALVACNKKEDDNSGQVIAQPPAPNANCLNGQTNCNPALYNQYNQFGFQPYGINPYQYGGMSAYWGMNGNYGQFCNCPAGFQPGYSGYMGLGCVNTTYLQPMTGINYWGIQPNNYQWVNIGQVSNINGYPQTQSCTSNLLNFCRVDQRGSCGTGICRPTAGGSIMGVCSTQ